MPPKTFFCKTMEKEIAGIFVNSFFQFREGFQKNVFGGIHVQESVGHDSDEFRILSLFQPLQEEGDAFLATSEGLF